jgi:hypothetical protein
VVADQESRDILGQQWLDVRPGNYPPLSEGLLHRSVRLAIHPSTDDLYISWRPDLQSLHSEAFSVNWKHLAGYAFPPFNLIARVLNKVVLDKTEIVLVAPIWQAQPWWPLQLSLLVQQPIRLPTSDKPDRSSTDSPDDHTPSSGRVSYLQQR